MFLLKEKKFHFVALSKINCLYSQRKKKKEVITFENPNPNFSDTLSLAGKS